MKFILHKDSLYFQIAQKTTFSNSAERFITLVFGGITSPENYLFRSGNLIINRGAHIKLPYARAEADLYFYKRSDITTVRVLHKHSFKYIFKTLVYPEYLRITKKNIKL